MRSRNWWRAALLGLLIACVHCGAGLPASQGQTQTTKTSTASSDQSLHDEIEYITFLLSKVEAWYTISKNYEDEMRFGSRVAVEGGKETVFMDRVALRGSLQRHVMQSIMAAFVGSGDYSVLAQLADANLIKSMVADLEKALMEKSNAYLERWAATTRKLGAYMQRLRTRRADLEQQLRRRAGGRAAPVAPANWYADLAARKTALGAELDQIRKAGNWVADHHFQVGLQIGYARTPFELDATEREMHEFEACYTKSNADRAEILAAARAGRYSSAPGDRIVALDQVAATFNRCIGAAVQKRKDTLR